MAGKFNLQIFVPVNLNDGTPTPFDAQKYAERTLCNLGGGVTITEAFGVWFDSDGKEYREPVQIIETDAEGDRESLTYELEALALRLAIALHQKAIYIRVREIDARLMTPNDRDR